MRRVSIGLSIGLAGFGLSCAICGLVLIQHIQPAWLCGTGEESFNYYYDNLVAFHVRVDRNLEDGVVLFVGDSHIQGLAVSAVTPNSANFGIGRDTSAGVLKRITGYQSLQRAGALVLMVGYNDLKRGAIPELVSNYSDFLRLLPEDLSVIVCAILPTSNTRSAANLMNSQIMQANQALFDLASSRDNVHFLDVFSVLNRREPPPREYFLEDGIHLSELGYSFWIERLRESLQVLGVHEQQD